MKKKISMHIALIVLLAIPLFFLYWGWLNLNSKSEPEYRYENVTATEPRVYVTRTGDRYHNASCGYLHSSMIAKGRNQAIEEGYIACSICGGRASGSITVTYKKRVPYDPTAKNIGGSVALSVLTAPLIYGFAYMIIKDFRENHPRKARQTNQSSNIPTTTSSRSSTSKSISTTSPVKEKSQADTIERIHNAPIEIIRNFIGERVSHKKYGTGVIVNIDQHYVRVQFNGISEIKSFQFPEAFFDGYLSIIK